MAVFYMKNCHIPSRYSLVSIEIEIETGADRSETGLCSLNEAPAIFDSFLHHYNDAGSFVNSPPCVLPLASAGDHLVQSPAL